MAKCVMSKILRFGKKTINKKKDLKLFGRSVWSTLQREASGGPTRSLMYLLQ